MQASSPASLTPRYFDEVYRANADPWDFTTSAYEAAKYRETIATLAGRHYASGLEIGCSIGVLSAQLAGLCDRLLAVDVAEAALQQARARCAFLPHVLFDQMQLPQQFPTGRFDLVVLSEVGYYWSAADLRLACDRIAAALLPGGAWLLVHWTPPVPDYPLRGDDVHEHVLARSGAGRALQHVNGTRHETYRLDLFVKSS